MESLFVLAALVFIVGPIVLFFLVIGARVRVGVLERSVEKLQEEVRQLRMRAATAPVAESVELAADTGWQAERSAPVTPDEAGAEIDYGPAFVPEPAPSLGKSPPPETPAEYDLGPATIPGYDYTPRESVTPAEHYAASELPEPPAWLIKAKEWLFGGNLVAKAGLLILFFGVSFLLKYAAARVSVPIELRLAGIVLADIGLLLWGWRIRESRPSISLPVQGAALGILMLVTFGAFRLYDLIPGGLAFGLLFFLTFFTCLLAVLQDAIWLAIFGIIGGFAAPVLTSTGQGSHIGLFSYYALLNAGILAIALKRSWRLLNLLGFAFTFVIGTTWGVLRYQPENYLSVQGFLILFFVFYVAIAILYASKQAPQLKHYVDGTLVFGTPLLAFGLQYGIVHDKPFGLAFSALALGLFYIGLTLALWQRRGNSLKLLVESFLALGIVFGTLAIPFALDGRWTSAAWALEGAGIVWVGLRQKQTLAWVFGVLVQVGAWVSFVASVNGLPHEIAAQSNLWLGFLLLAGTGFVMAMNFRKESRLDSEEGESSTPPIFTLLATVFLAFAAVWLLAGAWSEIFLHSGKHAHTLYVLSGMGVAGILGLIASRLDWRISRYFALVPQLLAGLVFLLLLDFNLDLSAHAFSDNLFETGFLGGLLIALGAGVSSLAFHRQPDDNHRSLSSILLCWCAFWWFAYVLGSLNAWGEHILASHNLFKETAYPLVHPLYGLLLALFAPVFVRLAKRLQWADLRWLAYAVWPGLLFAMLNIFQQLDSHLQIPPWPLWSALLALWLASEWLLRDAEREGWLLQEQQPGILRVLHTLRTVGPWLILWPLGHHLVTLGLQADSPEQAVLLAEAGWFTSGSWARYLPAWAMMAYVALLIPRARAECWPTTPIAGWYRDVLIPLGTLWSLGLAVIWNFTQNGLMEPLPYLPILNPLDLSTGFAALLAVSTWRMLAETSERTLPTRFALFAAIAAYVWFNLMLLRTAAHFLDIPYQFDPLFRSQFVQAMLSLVWSATALVLMRFAAKRVLRRPWMAGAGLLVLVVAKLFFVDLSNVGGIERIISFLGVGVLMLAIGYLAPLPTEKSTVAE
ncbi:DUF2339 domain-containing protein [Propionivibrio sp.]|uniref:DUF2339 domain-containing protein n=1 Tax=Propionivibrio sp. TaxID=2212460 RepID=UPI003BF2401E